jgi:hypothetical protein
MSRHEVPAINPNDKAVVGWDHPLLTFFAIVYDTTKPAEDNETGEIIRWVGTSMREIYEVEDLCRSLQGLVNLSVEMCSTLYHDKDYGK